MMDKNVNENVARMRDRDLHITRMLDERENDLHILAQVGRMYLEALREDGEDAINSHMTLPDAIALTMVREAVERWE